MAAPKLGWGHININVSDLDASIAFYEKLGFSVLIPGVPYLGVKRGARGELPVDLARALDVPESSAARACIMQLDDGFPKIDLTEYANASPQPAGANDDLGMVRLCLATRNLAQDYAALVAAGVEFVSPPTEGVGGMAHIAICRDPDGTLIELIELHLDQWAG
ncbi:MAG: VOC family protein [Pseudomonadota bacterium]